WGPFAAGSLIASVPIVAIFLSLQKYIISGLTAGSVKG
ncbi:MAG: sugar ABC transporter permease, partial [Actinobacteria bacterium]|nr:sugar ABC transporter permease [Actinomycetota bacterium]